MPLNSYKILFVINPFSGNQNKPDWEDEIRNYFLNSEHTIYFFHLSSQQNENSIKEEIFKIKPQRVIAVGGDGTVTTVAKSVMGTDIAMGILPAGSANGMARELEIPMDEHEAMELIIKGEIKKTDMVKVNDEMSLHLSDVGMNAELIKYFSEGNRRGKWGYARVLLKVLVKRSYLQVFVETEKMIVQRKALVVIIANASKYGFGAVINPDGNLHDGLFEVVVVRRLAVSELFKMWFRPQPFNRKKIEIYKAKSVKIEMKHKAHFQVDGEYLGKVDHVSARILPGILQLILPSVTEPVK
ncbi:MAG: diacylglycerol kinase family lipid kinase [Chitinophagaceae bacterium]|jgi:YegS/Rv2252/BmrU family lipid kinase|nr:diacylglycerol kinase family lipid kinase [Chitinophagaceae bacterium]